MAVKLIQGLAIVFADLFHDFQRLKLPDDCRAENQTDEKGGNRRQGRAEGKIAENIKGRKYLVQRIQ
jgi:hypothetical protein